MMTCAEKIVVLKIQYILVNWVVDIEININKNDWFDIPIKFYNLFSFILCHVLAI